MTPDDVYKFYGSQYQFNKQTGMSHSSLSLWLKQGYVPEDTQYKLERITGGKLKVKNEDITNPKPIIKTNAQKYLNKYYNGNKLDLIIRLHKSVAREEIKVELYGLKWAIIYRFSDDSLLMWDGESVKLISELI
ncbi:Cro/CI family transcriptional regulator [Legionella sainthelensi]|uniref:Cro/CI family transcriptional regulator n=1 Tax=Legionella sainthelensi TaxID=28087 RepID=UPI0013568FC4|nr:Cro/CI family transcriptional regulator [Legionella sainthelensi]